MTNRRRGQPGGDGLWRLPQRKTTKQAAIALANPMVRSFWSLTRNGTCHDAAQTA
jgi:hypothetical protein